jgi:hypothetical protein
MTVPKGQQRLKRRLRAGARRAGIQPGTDQWDAYIHGTAARVYTRRRRRRRGRR